MRVRDQSRRRQRRRGRYNPVSRPIRAASQENGCQMAFAVLVSRRSVRKHGGQRRRGAGTRPLRGVVPLDDGVAPIGLRLDLPRVVRRLESSADLPFFVEGQVIDEWTEQAGPVARASRTLPASAADARRPTTAATRLKSRRMGLTGLQPSWPVTVVGSWRRRFSFASKPGEATMANKTFRFSGRSRSPRLRWSGILSIAEPLKAPREVAITATRFAPAPQKSGGGRGESVLR